MCKGREVSNTHTGELLVKLEQWFSHLRLYQDLLEARINCRLLVPSQSRVEPELLHVLKFPSGTHVADPGPHSESTGARRQNRMGVLGAGNHGKETWASQASSGVQIS